MKFKQLSLTIAALCFSASASADIAGAKLAQLCGDDIVPGSDHMNIPYLEGTQSRIAGFLSARFAKPLEQAASSAPIPAPGIASVATDGAPAPLIPVPATAIPVAATLLPDPADAIPLPALDAGPGLAALPIQIAAK